MWLENSTFFFIGRTSREHKPHLREVRNQNGWTLCRSHTFVFGMWRPLLAITLSASAAFAQGQSTAYDALRVVGTQLDRSSVNRIISVSGSDGDPQPVRWTVSVADRAAAGGVREVEVANGRIVAQRMPGATGSSAGTTIKTARLNLDSSGAFSVASYTADKSHSNFALASYTLRSNERGEPVWIVTLQDENRRPIGTIHIGANKGNVTRVEGLYRGQSMAQVQEDPAPVPRSRREVRVEPSSRDDEELSRNDATYDARDSSADEDDDGDVNPVKKRVKQMFHRTKDDAQQMFQRTKNDAQRMFGRVRRNFEDYFYRN